MDSNIFRLGLPSNISHKIEKVEQVVLNDAVLLYGVLKLNYTPLITRASGVGHEILDILYEGIGDKIIISLPQNEEYQQYIKYIILSEYRDKKIKKENSRIIEYRMRQKTDEAIKVQFEFDKYKNPTLSTEILDNIINDFHINQELHLKTMENSGLKIS